MKCLSDSQVSNHIIPDYIAIHDYLYEYHDLDRHHTEFKGFFRWKLDEAFFESLKQEVLSLIKIDSDLLLPFSNSFASDDQRTKIYTGIPLTENFFGQALLGQKRNVGDLFKGDSGLKRWSQAIFKNDQVDQYNRHELTGCDREFTIQELTNLKVRHQYNDTYSQVYPRLQDKLVTLYQLIDSFPMQMVRSRVALFDPAYATERSREFMWHRDESTLLNVRLNIPIKTNDSFRIESKDDFNSCFEEGYVYFWDTSRVHRVSYEEKTSEQRIHLVLGFSPWFNFDFEKKAWMTSNNFKLKKPLEILQDYFSQMSMNRSNDLSGYEKGSLPS